MAYPSQIANTQRSEARATAWPDPARFDAEFLGGLTRTSQRLDTAWGGANEQIRLLSDLALGRAERVRKAHWTALSSRAGEFGGLSGHFAPAPALFDHFTRYCVDFLQRSILFIDVLRERGNSYIERDKEGFKPVLIFDYDMILDGRRYARPVNYALVRIVPPAGYPEQREDGRPFVIIDPRAGHGSGIGGYKSDSEVGVALRDGHPVYFVIFFTQPEPGQTLADVCAAEASFLDEVARRHPAAPKPLVIGNCQGGWAAMILAATHPEAPGPVVIAGAPLSYWAGERGKNPMRYLGGLAGGALPVLLASDLGGGRFDGANLVVNFEHLNPGQNWWRKYYDVFAKIDTEAPRYLEFERWWSGFYFMNEAEIRWIVETLFVGNKLTHGLAVLDDGTPIDLRRIKSPVVVLASHGDNITPPQQALNWIADLYQSNEEIAASGQVIIYTLHESVGHLGIFVSSAVARKQHKQITSVVKTIEALAPGLYEMIISTRDDGYHASFEQRDIASIPGLDGSRADEKEFAAIARLSEWASETYELTVRPLVQGLVTPAVAEAMVKGHPLRQRRYFFSDSNPWMRAVKPIADQVRAQRQPVAPDNPFSSLEELVANQIQQGWDLYRDTRDAMFELAFHTVWGAWWVKELAKTLPTRSAVHDFMKFPEVKAAIERVEIGGYAEAVIRMLVMMAHARGAVRQSRLARSNQILMTQEPFASMLPAERSHIIHEQTMIVDFAMMQARQSLPKLIPDPADRQKAIDLILDVAGSVDEMSAPTIAMFEQLQFILQVQAKGWTAPDHEVGPHEFGTSVQEMAREPEAEVGERVE
jgi:pimeloyl-ACP methyl ester carboxylesterase